ncbi:DUF3450 domain-containing protein [Solimonas sp. K1W22B-7]|uniref:DUF3450 domain-containing protein n=1 Tax=Solimonas sp. K1W22B-7 TaxID=2303331 RepID=UPI000E334450|nr:DUF3450 domain-containing protein [Solimonas sp. K1W22B-7]AXQ29090.1 DUF3450 domain-containing protein [Solimonas sp. K1W22B-7]
MKKILLAASAAMLALTAAAQTDPVSRAIDATVQTNKASAASQQRVNEADDQTRAMLERYRAATWQAQQLRVYANQIEPLLAAQEAEKQNLQRQLAELDRAGGDMMPLMLRMIDSLEKFVALDLPFLQDERRERLAELRRKMTDSETATAEKFRMVLEAYQVEAGYGRSLLNERGRVDERLVEVLSVGRTAMFAVALDGEEVWSWSPAAKKWEPLARRYAKDLRLALKMSHGKAAPDLLTLPMPVARVETGR